MNNKTNELKLSWDKKISMREIAQFYEDKIRELDGKTQRLTEQNKMLSEQSEKMMDQMRAKVDKTLDERAGQKISSINKQILSFEEKIEDLNQRAKIALDFLSKYDDIKELIEHERKISGETIRKFLEIEEERDKIYNEGTERIIRAQKEGHTKVIISSQLEIAVLVSDFYRFLFDHDRGFFEAQSTFFEGAKKNPDVFLPLAYNLVKGGEENATKDFLLPIINNLISDYTKMFSLFRNEDAKTKSVGRSTTGSD